jgi:hypothetical protein
VERDALTTTLTQLGMVDLALGGRPRRGIPPDPRGLFRRRCGSDDPRLHEAIIHLLTRPDFAVVARALIADLTRESWDGAARRYLAAAAMLRIARPPIPEHLGEAALIGPAYVLVRSTPPLDEDFGRKALRALANAEDARHG